MPRQSFIIGRARAGILALRGARVSIVAACLLLGVAPGASAAVVNDKFANALDLGSGSTASTLDHNVAATKEVDEPDHGFDSGGASVWYRWTATVESGTRIDTCGSDFDTLLGVYTGSAVNMLTTVASNDDDVACGLGSSVTFTTTVGTVYWIAVDGYSYHGFDPPDQGVIELDIALVPTANSDTATVGEDSDATTIDVLANDTETDPAGQPKSIWWTTQPRNGNVVVASDDFSLTYEPDADYCNDPGTAPEDTFDYTLEGGSTATVSIAVSCVGDPPTIISDPSALSYLEGAPATSVDPSLAVSDVDDSARISGAAVSISDGFSPAEDELAFSDQGGIGGSYNDATGVLTVEGDASVAAYESALRSVTYENNSENPDTATRTVSFQVTDAEIGTSNVATREVQIDAVDDAPTAVEDAATVAEDSSANPIDVVANDIDIDGGPTSIQSTTDPLNGTLAITAGGTGVAYTPAANYCNDAGAAPDDTFTYALNGGSIATVSVTVTCVDDPVPPSPNPSVTTLLPASGPTGQRAVALRKCKKKKGAARMKCRKTANKLPV